MKNKKNTSFIINDNIIPKNIKNISKLRNKNHINNKSFKKTTNNHNDKIKNNYKKKIKKK